MAAELVVRGHTGGGGDGGGGGGGEDGGDVGGEGEGGGGDISGGGDGVLLGSQPTSAPAGLQYKLSVRLPVHFALKIAWSPTSQKLKPNFSLWKKGTLCVPQNPSVSKVVHRARLHLIDLPKGRDGGRVEWGGDTVLSDAGRS